MTGVTITNYLTSLGEISDFLFGKFGDVLDLFVTHPYLMVVSGIMIAGAVIGLVSRLANR